MSIKSRNFLPQFLRLLFCLLLASCGTAMFTQSPEESDNVAQYRSGLIMLQFPSSDGFIFDFSTSDLSLEEPPTVDLTIGANALQRFHAPHGIMMLGPIPDCTLSATPHENIVDVILERLHEKPIAVPMTDYRTSIDEVSISTDCRPIIVRTWEGDYVLLLPVARYIGAYDRYWMVWIYAADGVRDFVLADPVS